MSEFHGDYVSHIVEMGPDVLQTDLFDYWWIEFLNGDTTRRIRIRQLSIQSVYRNNEKQILIYTPTVSYGLEGDKVIIDKIDESLKAVTQ